MYKTSIAWALTVGSAVKAQTPCESTDILVNLNNCPLQLWKTSENPTTPEDPLEMVFRVTTHQVPAKNAETGDVIPDETIEIQARTYAFNEDGFEPSLPPPIMQWEKGATVYMELFNDLHVDYIGGTDDFIIPEDEWLEPHHATNIHTHGLHIDSFADDPSREIHVNESGFYEFNLPEDHAYGLHWYHPHIEQASEMTLSAGCFSGLIVEPDTTGLEMPVEILELETHYLMFNKFFPQKLLDLKDGFDTFFSFIPGVGNPRLEVFHPDFNMVFDNSIEAELGFDDITTNYTLVNGFLKPKVVLQSGEWYRYSMLWVSGLDPIFAISDIKMRIGKNPELNRGAASDYGPFDEFFGTTCEVKLLAKDGVNLRESRDINFDEGDRIWLSPANRAEIMIKCTIPEQNSCDVVDNTFAFIQDIPRDSNRADNIDHSETMIQIEVRAQGIPQSTLGAKQVEDPDFDFTVEACLPSYLPDMVDLTPTELEPHFGFSEDILDTIRETSLDLGVALPFYNVSANEIGINISPFSVNGESFNGYDRPDSAKNITVLNMQKVYGFKALHGHHPQHYHVNHVQLVTPSDDGSNYHLPGDYLDTVMAPCPEPDCEIAGFRPAEMVSFRMFTDRFSGRLLLHCHIMDHSDTKAVAEMFVLEDEEFLANYVPPVWEDTCGEVMTIAELDSPEDQCKEDNDTLVTILVVFFVCQLLLMLMCFLAYRAQERKKQRKRRESSIIEDADFAEESKPKKRRSRSRSRDQGRRGETRDLVAKEGL
eukprot:snap_masked-scaffold_4-processed-gene-14.17-mRNA-1 protein AED:0.98 eAED:1.00 QI:0/-1/0/1/-1/1/1/0/763